MENIKVRKQLTHVILTDGRVLVTEASVSELYKHLDTHWFLMVEGEAHSKSAIKSLVPAKMDDLESFILSQPKAIQNQLRAKIYLRKHELGKDTTIGYAQNYVKNVLNKTL